ncbi:hypothetical protein ACA910_020681 [Epithemia clementina (nom. ined.)]
MLRLPLLLLAALTTPCLGRLLRLSFRVTLVLLRLEWELRAPVFVFSVADTGTGWGGGGGDWSDRALLPNKAGSPFAINVDDAALLAALDCVERVDCPISNTASAVAPSFAPMARDHEAAVRQGTDWTVTGSMLLEDEYQSGTTYLNLSDGAGSGVDFKTNKGKVTFVESMERDAGTQKGSSGAEGVGVLGSERSYVFGFGTKVEAHKPAYRNDSAAAFKSTSVMEALSDMENSVAVMLATTNNDTFCGYNRIFRKVLSGGQVPLQDQVPSQVKIALTEPMGAAWN